MATRAIALILAVGVAAFAGFFVWGGLRSPVPNATTATGDAPAAAASEQIGDGRIDLQVYPLGNQGVRLEIQFVSDVKSGETIGTQPDVNFAMVDMHMDGVSPPLEQLGPSAWRAQVKLPMAGRWVVNAGYAEEFAEVEFDVR